MIKLFVFIVLISTAILQANEPPSFKAERGRPRMLNWADSYFKKIIHEAVMREPDLKIASSKPDIITLLAPSGFVPATKEANVKRKIA